jgi:alkylation response protein AidB-like acyl-CoA dehydrogenase
MKFEALRDYVKTETLEGIPLREDPIARQRIAQLATELEVARMLQRRVIASAIVGGVPTVESSMYKLYMTQFGQRLADTALDLMGHDGQLKPGQPDAQLDGRFERSYRYTVVDTIGGGTSEIQKNIIAQRGLGLPRSF